MWNCDRHRDGSPPFVFRRESSKRREQFTLILKQELKITSGCESGTVSEAGPEFRNAVYDNHSVPLRKRYVGCCE
jgi:hypothetical protein